MRDVYDPIPKRCASCPVIFPVLDEYLKRESELYIAEFARHRLNEYADMAAIDARIIELRQRVSGLQEQLEGLRGRTIGCHGVRLAQVKIGDDYITSAECPLED